MSPKRLVLIADEQCVVPIVGADIDAPHAGPQVAGDCERHPRLPKAIERKPWAEHQVARIACVDGRIELQLDGIRTVLASQQTANGNVETRERFPRAAIVLELHLLRDPENASQLLAAIGRDGYSLRAINYGGQVASTTENIVLSQPEEHWTFWLVR